MLRRVGVRRQWETPLPWENDLTSYLCPKSLVFALPSAPLSPCVNVHLLLGSSPLQTIQLTGTLLSFTRLAATNFAYECREQCHGNHLVTVRASEHFPIILSSFACVKGGSLNLSHSQGLEGYF